MNEGETMAMNWDVNNYHVLAAGAKERSASSDGWQEMSSAPRDGTWIEVKNTYGVAPSYGLARWTDEGMAHGPDGLVPYKRREPAWDDGEGGGYMDGEHLHWRPYDGNPKTYIDPTGGLQNSPAYWRGAAAAENGLPLDFFEADTARNIAERKTRRQD